MRFALPIALLFALPGLAQEGNRAAPADELGLVAPPLVQGFPGPNAEGVPTNTLIWTNAPALLVGPDGEVALTEVARFNVNFGTQIIAQDPGPLPANTQFTVLEPETDFELATFTTGDSEAEPAAAPRIVNVEEVPVPGPIPPFSNSRALSVELQWSGVALLVEPDADSLDALSSAESLLENDFLSFSLDNGTIEKRLVVFNAAGEMSDETVLTHEPAGCAQVTGELLALWPILGLLALRRRRR